MTVGFESTALTPTDMQQVDAYVRRTTPTLTVPLGSALPEMTAPGHRYLLAADGLYGQFRRAWCDGAVQLARSQVPLPFGQAPQTLVLRCARLPKQAIADFIHYARQALPNEVAAWLVWDEAKPDPECWSLRLHGSISSSAGHIRYERPMLPSGQHAVVDLHSHGYAPAYFSEADNSDDRRGSEVQLAMVVGSLVNATPTIALRLCALGTFTDLKGHLHATAFSDQ